MGVSKYVVEVLQEDQGDFFHNMRLKRAMTLSNRNSLMCMVQCRMRRKMKLLLILGTAYSIGQDER